MSIVSGKRLKRLRERAGKTQSDISQLLGVTAQNISAYERGREPSFSTLFVLAQFYGVTADYILGLSDFETPVQEKTIDNIDLMQSIPHRLRQYGGDEQNVIMDLLITTQEYCKHGFPAKDYPIVLATSIMQYAMDFPTEGYMRKVGEADESDTYPVSLAAEFLAHDCIDSLPIRMEGYERIVMGFLTKLHNQKESEDNSHAKESEQ